MKRLTQPQKRTNRIAANAALFDLRDRPGFLRVCSRIAEAGQTPYHELDHGGLDEGEACLGEALHIL